MSPLQATLCFDVPWLWAGGMYPVQIYGCLLGGQLTEMNPSFECNVHSDACMSDPGNPTRVRYTGTNAIPE
jgi:hypothetical protein